MLENLTKKIAALVPGSVANLAADKRKYERLLREKGYSRTHAVAMTALHFKSKSILQRQ